MPSKPSRLRTASVFLAVAGLGLASFAPTEGGAAIAVPLLGAVGILAVLAVVRFQADPEDRAILFGFVFLAVAARLFVFTLVRETVGPYVFAPDAYTYEVLGQQLLESWRGLRLAPPRATETLQVGYIYMNAGLFWLFGRSPSAPAVVNVFLGSLTVVPVYHLARTVCRGHRGVATWAAGLTALFPSLILWSTLNIREAPTILLLTTGVFFAVRFQHEGRFWDLAGFIVPILVVALFREYLMVLVAVAAAAGVVVGKTRTPIRAMLGGFVTLMVATLALQGAGVGTSLAADPSLERIEYLRQDLALGAGSAYGTEADVSTVGGALSFLPVGLAYFLLAPFPWSVTSVLQAITFPESILWYVLVLFGVRGLWLALKHDARSYTVVFMVLVTVTFAYALVEGNVGTAYRHRAQILPLSFVIISVGLQDFWAVRRARSKAGARRRRELTGRVPLRRPQDAPRAGGVPGPAGDGG